MIEKIGVDEAEARKLAEFDRDFIHNHVGEEELATVQWLVMSAVKDGKIEAMAYSFPSDRCTDGGRAINNCDPRWPETLQGKAKEFHDGYEELAKPQGYKLKAMVINFPGGISGDIGFFWTGLRRQPEGAARGLCTSRLGRPGCQRSVRSADPICAGRSPADLVEPPRTTLAWTSV
jgi:hypothetical protein